MNGTRIALSDLIAIPAYERLQDGMRGLAAIARKELTTLCKGYAWGDFKVPHGWTSGEFNEPQFFGGLLTPGGVKANDSSRIVWLGILAKPAYGIGPHIDGIPELSVGIGLWTEQPPSALECTGLTERLRQDLSALAPNMNWEVDWMPHAADDEIFSLVARARLSLIELHQQTGEDFWDDAAQSFFNTAGKAVFSLPAEIWEKFRTLES